MQVQRQMLGVESQTLPAPLHIVTVGGEYGFWDTGISQSHVFTAAAGIFCSPEYERSGVNYSLTSISQTYIEVDEMTIPLVEGSVRENSKDTFSTNYPYAHTRIQFGEPSDAKEWMVVIPPELISDHGTSLACDKHFIHFVKDLTSILFRTFMHSKFNLKPGNNYSRITESMIAGLAQEDFQIATGEMLFRAQKEYQALKKKLRLNLFLKYS